MPIRGTSVTIPLNNPLVIAKPAGVRVGDLMVMWLESDWNTFPTLLVPAGWQSVKPRNSIVTVDNSVFAVGWRVAGPNEPASYNPTVSSNQMIGGIVALSGVTPQRLQSGHIRISTSLSSPWQLRVPAFTMADACEVLVIANIDIKSASDVVYTPRVPFKVAQDITSGFSNVIVAHRAMPTGGHTGANIGVGTFAGGIAGLQFTTLALSARGARGAANRLAPRLSSTLATALTSADGAVAYASVTGSTLRLVLG